MEINGKDYTVDPQLDYFVIKAKESENIEFYGFQGNVAFIQFHSGSVYFYPKPEDMDAFVKGGFYKCKTINTHFGKLIIPKPNGKGH